MKTFVTETGETAYVPTSFEIEIIQTALRQFQSTLPDKGEIVNG